MTTTTEEVDEIFKQIQQIDIDVQENGLEHAIARDSVRNIIKEALKANTADTIERVREEILKRADELEHECGHTDMHQWRAFKGFRNGIQDYLTPPPEPTEEEKEIIRED